MTYIEKNLSRRDLSRRDLYHSHVGVTSFDVYKYIDLLKKSVKGKVSFLQENRDGDKIKKIEDLKKAIDGFYGTDKNKKLFLNAAYEFGKIVFEPICKINDEGNFEKFKEELLFNIVENNDLGLDDIFRKKLRNEILNYFREEGYSFELFKIISEKIIKLPNINNSRFSFNLENQDIINIEFKDFIEKTFSNNNSIKNKNISFELLEHTDIKNENKKLYIENLKFLKKLGFKISIDDLFSGHSTIEKVDWLIENGINIDSIKIDMDIIHKGKSHDDFEKNKKNIYDLKNRGIKIIAEGIENKEHLEYAKSLGAEYFQGHIMKDLF